MNSTVPVRSPEPQTGLRTAAVYYILPFAVFMALLALRPYTNLAPRVEFLLRAVLVGGAILFVAPKTTGWRINYFWSGIALGIAVFLVWIGPDALIPGWRQSVIFQNAITGKVSSTINSAAHTDAVLIALRCLQAVILVPIAEELFWRGWVLRWLVDKDFERVAIGAYTAPPHSGSPPCSSVPNMAPCGRSASPPVSPITGGSPPYPQPGRLYAGSRCHERCIMCVYPCGKPLGVLVLNSRPSNRTAAIPQLKSFLATKYMSE